VVAGLEDEHTSSVGRAVFEEVLRCSRDFPELDGAVRRLLAADDERVRVSGIRITAALGLSAAAEILGEVIASEDEAVVSRTAAAETLVEFGPAAVGDAVIAVFVSSSTTADLKRNLASLLRGAPVPSVVDALHRTLKDPSNPRSVRRSCIESLAAIGSKTSTSVLESVLLTARNEIEIAPAAVRALASCGASAVIERLASESNWNEPVASRRALYDALGSVGTAAAEATLLARVGKERDARALGSCIRALKRFRSPHSEAVLLTTLTTDWLPPGLRSEAADALATSDRSDILVELLKHLQAADPDPYVWDAIFFSAHGLWRRLGTRAPTGTMDAIAALIRQPAPEPPEVEDLVQLLRATVRGDRDAESRLRSACRFLMGDSKQSAHMRRLGSILLQVAAGERQPPLETLPADISVRLAQALQTLEER
jgi:HEAT repeat protein